MRSFPFAQTVSARLTLLNVSLLALILLLLGSVLQARVSVNLMRSVDHDLELRASRHRFYWANVPGASHHHGRPRPVPGRRTSVPAVRDEGAAPAARPAVVSRWRTPVVERVFDLSGEQSWPPEKIGPPWAGADFARAVHGKDTLSTLFDGPERVRVLSSPLRRRSGEIAGVVQVGASLDDVDRSLANLNQTLFTMAPIALLISGLGGLMVTAWMHRPLRRVNQAIAQIGAEDLSRRLVVDGRDEFSILATNFNAMLGRLEQAFELQRRFAADASHELRTPLTVIKVYSSRGQSDPESTAKQRLAWTATDRAATLMTAIVQDLLLLARADAGQLTPRMRALRLRDVLDSAEEGVDAESGARIVSEAAGDVFVSGDEILLTRVFTNLLKNALCYTPGEGLITLRAERSGPFVIVSVTDTGAGISGVDLPHVMERFYRADEARSRAEGGTGLGLAICQSLLSPQGGRLKIESEFGHGTTARVWLMASEADAAAAPAFIPSS